jgi:hypothetical protein
VGSKLVELVLHIVDEQLQVRRAVPGRAWAGPAAACWHAIGWVV